MLHVEGNPERLIIHCDRCPIQMDLGPAAIAQRRGVNPTGWVHVSDQKHLCPSCASKADVLVEFADAG